MASPMIELCEQANPLVLAQVKKAGVFRNAHRIHGSFLAGIEKRALVWMAERMPSWVSPDQLTVLGFAAQIGAGVCYALSGWDSRLLLLGIVCLALNWFGDSLDGTLARVRQQQRPRYGFYVDHMIDSFGSVALMGGLALSGYMHPAIAIGLLVGFLVLLGGVLAALWKLGVIEAIGGTWTAIGVAILVGIGIMMSVANSGTKENISIDRK